MNEQSSISNAPVSGSGTQTKRVLLVARPMAGGMRRHLEGLLKYLPEYGYTPTLIGPDFVPDRPTPLADGRAVKILRQRGADFPILHAHGVRAGWVCALAFRSEKPWLWTVHHLLMERNPFVRATLRWIAKQSRFIIAVSRAVEQSLAHMGLPTSKLATLHGGIDPQLFQKLPDRERVRRGFHVEIGKPIILAAGRFVYEKGFDLAIQAMETVWQKVPEAELWLAGEGPENTRLVRLAIHSSQPSKIRFFGYWTEIGEMYAACDLLVAPSRREGQGLVILEAMICRIPIVATRVGGLAEMIQDGESGLLVPIEDPEALGEAIARLLTQPELAQHLIQKAQAVVQRFDIRPITGQIAQYYDRLLAL